MTVGYYGSCRNAVRLGECRQVDGAPGSEAVCVLTAVEAGVVVNLACGIGLQCYAGIKKP